MDTGVIKFVQVAGPEKVFVEWRRIGPLPGDRDGEEDPSSDDAKLPLGVFVQNGDLIIPGATLNHSGIYEATVFTKPNSYSNPEVLEKFTATIKVLPMNPGSETELDPGKAGQLPSDKDKKPESEGEPGYEYRIVGFTPDAKYCKNPSWYLVDYIMNTTIDISDKIVRDSQNEFRIRYPLTSGTYIQFVCQPVPNTSLIGDIRFNLTSTDPRLSLKQEKKPGKWYPERLVCLDLNPALPSELTFEFKPNNADSSSELNIEELLVPGASKKLTIPTEAEFDSQQIRVYPYRTAIIDFNRVGGFDPSKHSGTFICKAKNPKTESTLEIALPSVIDEEEEIDLELIVYAVDQILYPRKEEADYILQVEEGDNYEVRWTESAESPERVIINEKSWGVINAQGAKKEEDGLIFICSADNLPERKIILKVTEKSVPPSMFAVKSFDNAMDGKFVGLIGEDIDFKCNQGDEVVPGMENKWEFYDNKMENPLDWTAVKALASEVVLDGPDLKIKGLKRPPSQLKVVCVNVPPNKDPIRTKPIKLQIREVIMEVEAQSPALQSPTLLVGNEGENVEVKCIAKDKYLKTRIKNVDYTWQVVTQSKKLLVWQPGQEVPDELLLPNNRPKPWQVASTTAQGAYIIGKLTERPDWTTHVRCKVFNEPSGQTVLSELFKIQVVPKKEVELHPNLDIVPEFSDKSLYPVAVKCIDRTTDVKSDVTWEFANQEIKSEKPNYNEIRWPEFDPRVHAGFYVCTAKNKFKTQKKNLLIPRDLMPQQFMPSDQLKLVLKSDVNEIMKSDLQPVIRIKKNNKLELYCVYYGHPPPEKLRWTVKFSDDVEALNTQQITKRNLMMRYGPRYWTVISTKRFHAGGDQVGMYTCEALDQDNLVIKSESCTISQYKSLALVKMDMWSRSWAGATRSNAEHMVRPRLLNFLINPIDSYGNFKLDDVQYSWKFEDLDGNAVHENELADKVKIEGNKLIYEGLRDFASQVRVQCLSFHASGSYVSPFFSFNVPEQDMTGSQDGGKPRPSNRLLVKTKVLQGFEQNKDAVISCEAIDSVLHTPMPKGSFVYLWELMRFSSQLPLPEYDITNQPVIIDQENGFYTVKQIKASPDYPKPVGELYCVALELKTRIKYRSEPVYVQIYPAGQRDLDKEKAITDELLGKVVVVEGVDSRGVISALEGENVKLSCQVKNKSTMDPIGGFKYAWKFYTLSGQSIDSSVLADSNMEVSGNELNIQRINAISGIKGVCEASEEDAEPNKSVYVSRPFTFEIISLIDQKLSDKIPQDMNDRETLKAKGYEIVVEGLDNEGILNGQAGDEKQLTCTLKNLESGEPIGGEKETGMRVRYGWEFVYLDGTNAAPNTIAASAKQDLKAGTIVLNELKSLEGIPPEKRVKGRCIVSIIEEDKSSSILASLNEEYVWRKPAQRYPSKFFLVNVPPIDSSSISGWNVDSERYAVSFEDLRKDEENHFLLIPGRVVNFNCKVMDKVTGYEVTSWGSPNSIIWQLPKYFSGQVGSPEELANDVNRNYGNQLELRGIRSGTATAFYGGCIFHDGKSFHYSPYKLMKVLQSTSDGRVTVEVDKGPNSWDQTWTYTCQARHALQDKDLNSATYSWEFVTSSGEKFPIEHLYEDVAYGPKTITFGKPKKLDHMLGKNETILGYCRAYVAEFAGSVTDGSEPVNTYLSPAFVEFKPKEDGEFELSEEKKRAPVQDLTLQISNVKDRKLQLKKDQELTINCKLIDTITSQAITSDINFMWEIQQLDGQPADTALLASEGLQIGGENGESLTIKKAKTSANTLRARCIAVNTAPEGTEPTRDFAPGQKLHSDFFNFLVRGPADEKTSLLDETQRVDIIDSNLIPFILEVQPNEDGNRISSNGGSDLELDCVVKDKSGNAISSDQESYQIGWSIRYTDGRPAPISLIAKSIRQENGKLILNGYLANPIPTPGLVIQCLLESRRPQDLKLAPSENARTVRFGSPWYFVTKDDRSYDGHPTELTPKKNYSIVVEGLNDCGNLYGVPGQTIELVCKIEGIADTQQDTFHYDWELIHGFGQQLPVITEIGESVKTQNSKLTITGYKKPSFSVLGRCLATDPLRTNRYLGHPVSKAPLDETIIDWEFFNKDYTIMPESMLANSVKTTKDGRIILKGLKKTQGFGVCRIIIMKKDKELSMDDELSQTQLNPDKKVIVSIQGTTKGPDERDYASLRDWTDELRLKCIAKTVNDELLKSDDEAVQYGWIWRRLNEEGLAPSEVASKVTLDKETLKLQDFKHASTQAKGQCVVHVKEGKIRPDSANPDRIITYTSEPFFIKVAALPPVRESGEQMGDSALDNIKVVVYPDPEGDQGEVSNFKCEVQNMTTSAPLDTNKYSIDYSWEFRDFSGLITDSAHVADQVQLEPNGVLALKGIRSSKSGQPSVKSRCVARVLDKRDFSKPIKVHYSDYVSFASKSGKPGIEA
ncbi:hypothetical protein Ciccas_008835, partial [Cichlidogyrus casuarinus]